MHRPPRILSIEDNTGDSRLLQEAFIESGFTVDLEVIPNGRDGIARLESTAPYLGSAIPDLVVLDLNLPGLYGHELLSMIRDDERLSRLRTVILTSSDDTEEIAFCTALGVDAFMRKPLSIDGYRDIISTMAQLLSDSGLGSGMNASR